MFQHNYPAMLKPLYTMALVFLYSIISLHAQSSLDNTNKLCLIGLDQTAQKVNMYVEQSKPVTITCSNEDGNVFIPKFVQFTCEEGASFVTVEVKITDGTHNQTISKNIEITENNSLYEMPVLTLVNNEILQSGRGHVKSIVFKNNMSSTVMLSTINFSNTTINYEVKLNQVFTIDFSDNIQKNYLVNANTYKDVNINLYKSNGEFDHSIAKSLVKGENFLRFADMQMKSGKYVIVITEVDPSKKAPNNRITVMY